MQQHLGFSGADKKRPKEFPPPDFSHVLDVWTIELLLKNE